MPLRVGERLEVLVAPDCRKLLERRAVARLPDAVLDVRGRVALHRHHVEAAADGGEVDRMRKAVLEGEALGRDRAVHVHRRGERAERQAHHVVLRDDVVEPSPEGRDAAHVDERAPMSARPEFAVGHLPSVEERVPGCRLLVEPSVRFREAPERRIVELGGDCVVVEARQDDAAVLERKYRDESPEVLFRLEVDVRAHFAGHVVRREGIVDELAVRSVGIVVPGRDGSHLAREHRVVLEPVRTSGDAKAGEIEVCLVFAEVPEVRVGAVVARAADQIVERIPVYVGGLRPRAVGIAHEKEAVVRIVLLRVRRARPDASVGELLEVLDLFRAGGVLVRPGRRRAGKDRHDWNGARVVVPLARADVDASVDVLEAVDGAREESGVVRPRAPARLGGGEKVFERGGRVDGFCARCRCSEKRRKRGNGFDRFHHAPIIAKISRRTYKIIFGYF